MAEIKPLKHQKAIVSAPFALPDFSYFILCGGYGCGKSFSIILAVVAICKKYQGSDVTVALCSTTITLLNKTVILELEKLFKKTGSTFDYNQKDNVLSIGTIRFLLIATGQPTDIYGPNVNITLCDEIDELPEGKALDAHKALAERTRLTLPDGRKPFVMYFSTVHGYRGLYRICRQLKAGKVKHCVVRGLTKDNVFLDPQYVKNLYAIYDENERMAFLEGLFVNLAAGRVYSDYDDAKMKVKPFEVTKDMTVYVGQDLNSGFSKACAVVKKDKRLYIIRGWSFKEVGGAPAIMRAAYPDNEVLWFPDCSGKEILKGYKQEIIDNGIECRIGASNPRILDRVFYVNKMFKLGLLRVFDCPETDGLSESLKVRAYNDMGQPEKGKGEDAPDHYCFVAGTMVATSEGWRPIETVKKGDLVLTEKGYKKVKAAGLTGKRRVITRAGLTGTPDHPIKCDDNNYEPLETARECHRILWEDAEWLRLLHSMESSIDGTRTRRTRRTENTTRREKPTELLAELDTFTETYGKPLTEKYRRDVTSTIRTAILATTTSRTLNASKGLGTIKSTIQSEIQEHLRRMITRKPLTGTEARKDTNGTQGLPGFTSASARFAEPSTKRKETKGRIGAESGSALGIAPKSTTAERVEDVYNLSVTGTHTYFANGVLVHNCDAVEYVIYRLVRSDPDFMDLKDLSRETAKESGYLKMGV